MKARVSLGVHSNFNINKRLKSGQRFVNCSVDTVMDGAKILTLRYVN